MMRARMSRVTEFAAPDAEGESVAAKAGSRGLEVDHRAAEPVGVGTAGISGRWRH
jgi:hypothetical protein